MEQYLKKTEIAEFYQVSSQTVDTWVREGKLKIAHRTPGGRPRFLNPKWVEPRIEAIGAEHQGVA